MTGNGSTELRLLYNVWKPVMRARETTDPASGRVATYKARWVQEQRIATIAADSLKVFDTNGKQVAPDRYPEIFAGRRPVMVSANHEPVHPLYLRNLKEDTLIVVTTKR